MNITFQQKFATVRRELSITLTLKLSSISMMKKMNLLSSSFPCQQPEDVAPSNQMVVNIMN